MSAQHTHGPWTGFLGEDGDEGATWLIGPSSARPIVATVGADEECGLTGATVEANARLIAAAPELLVAAKAVIRAFGFAPPEGVDLPTEWDDLAAAIAKATGVQP
jgi:hypothetical protein